MEKSPQEHFESLRRKPAMYLGEKSLSLFVAFTQGYILGVERLPKADQAGDPFIVPGSFHEWVRKWYGEPPSSKGWFTHILEHSNTEEAALDKFFELYDEFRGS